MTLCSVPGRLQRIEAYDAETRQVTLVVSIQAAAETGQPPLVAGMFCQVRIPGKILESTYADVLAESINRV